MAGLAIATAASCNEPLDPTFGVSPSGGSPIVDSTFGPSAVKWYTPQPTVQSVLVAAMDTQRLYVAEHPNSGSNKLVAFNVSNGVALWTKDITDATDIVSTGSTVAAISTSAVGFDPATGASKFTYAPTLTLTSNAVSEGTRIYVGNSNGDVIALNPTTGAEIWKTRVDTRQDSTSVLGVAISGTTVIAGGIGYVAAVDAGTGVLKWKRPSTDSLKPYVTARPATEGGRIGTYGLKGSAQTLMIVNYDETNGALKWSTGAAVTRTAVQLKGPPGCDGVIVYESGAPGVTALNATTGTTVWSRSVTYQSLSANCMQGSLFVNALTGSRSDVVVLRAQNGTLQAQYPTATATIVRVWQTLRNAAMMFFVITQGVVAVNAPS